MRLFASIVGLLALCAASAHAQDRWVVGQSAPLTGGNARFGNDVRDAAAAMFAAINAQGGVAGKPIELVTLDDGNDRKKAAENTRQLIGERKALALFGYGSATLSLDALPQAEAEGVPFFAPFSGAAPVRTKSPVLFTIRASYAEEMEAMLNFWTSFGLKRVSVVHYDDEVGRQNLQVVTQFLRKVNVAPQAFAIHRNVSLGPSAAQSLIDQKPEVVLLTVLSGPAAQLQKELVARNYFVPTSSLSFVGAEQFVQAAGTASAGVSVAQVVPHPGKSLPAVRACAKAMADAGVKSALNSTHLEACFGAQILAEGIRRTRKPVNPQSLRDTLANLGTYDLGGFSVHFSPGSQHGSRFVELALVTRDGRLMR